MQTAVRPEGSAEFLWVPMRPLRSSLRQGHRANWLGSPARGNEPSSPRGCVQATRLSTTPGNRGVTYVRLMTMALSTEKLACKPPARRLLCRSNGTRNTFPN